MLPVYRLSRPWLDLEHLGLLFTQPIATAMGFAPERRPAARSLRHHPGSWCNIRAGLRSVCAISIIFYMVTAAAGSASFEDALKAYAAKDYRNAVSVLKNLADEGHVQAQAFLGAIYASGEGVRRDLALALKWHRMAAEQGYVQAQYNLAVSYAKGVGTKKDMRQAVFWFEKAAEQGLAEAQLHMGLMREKGWGGIRCPYEASSWYYRAGQTFLGQGNRKMARHALAAIHKVLPGYYLATELSDEIFLYSPDL